MKILLVGSGGREHALAWRLQRSPSVRQVLCPNGNPGIARHALTPAMDLPTPQAWVELARAERVDLVVVGPETPLADGLADALIARGVPVFGPTQAGARIESSKAWAKELLLEAGVPTARAESFSDAARAKDFARALGLPVVIKADGLAAGKGVTVATTWAQAEEAIDENLHAHRFGASSATILVEEFMQGEEASIFGLCDGRTVFPLVAAQDHKRVFDGDAGPNTGGMGAYAPAPVVSEELFNAIYGEVFRPTLEALQRRGIDYRGVLYAGVMITAEGPKVVEFNCRFGDPETQVVLPLLEGDLGEILLACAEGRLGPMTAGTPGTAGIGTRPGAAMTVVLASGGYPGSHRTGLPISGAEPREEDSSSIIFHAGTKLGSDGKTLLTAGGRVLAVTAWDTTLARARDRVYRRVADVSFEGCHFRRDIGWRALTPGRNFP